MYVFSRYILGRVVCLLAPGPGVCSYAPSCSKLLLCLLLSHMLFCPCVHCLLVVVVSLCASVCVVHHALSYLFFDLALRYWRDATALLELEVTTCCGVRLCGYVR